LNLFFGSTVIALERPKKIRFSAKELLNGPQNIETES